MQSISQLRVRNTLAAGFLAIIALSICGYANTVRVQQSTARRDRSTAARVNECISYAKDLALYSAQMSAFTGEYVHTGDVSYREFKWETDEKDDESLVNLWDSIRQLPDNAEIERKLEIFEKQDRTVARPSEDEAIRLETVGNVKQASTDYNVRVVPADYLIDNEIDALIGELNACELRSERQADRDSARAVIVGWSVQGVILVISLLIAFGISLVTGNNVRKIVEVQRRLSESESQLRTALTGAPLILFAMNPDGVFTLMEGQVLKNMGVPPGTMVGLAMQDMFPDRTEVIANIDRALAGECFTATVVFDGRTFSTTYNPQFDRDGRVTGIIGISTDVTDRAAAEHEAERLLCELEESNQELAQAYDTTIQGWSAALDLRDRETEGHSRRVTELSIQMAKAVGIVG